MRPPEPIPRPTGAALDAAIEAAWDALAELQDAGALSAAQFTHAMRVVEGYSDDELGRGLALRYLRMGVKAPGAIGVNLPEVVRPEACPRCHKVKGEPGWGFEDRDERTVPCEGCNPRMAQLYRHGHFDAGHGTCDECRPHRAKPGQTTREAEKDERTERSLGGLA